jgi:hypothetical protein
MISAVTLYSKCEEVWGRRVQRESTRIFIRRADFAALQAGCLHHSRAAIQGLLRIKLMPMIALAAMHEQEADVLRGGGRAECRGGGGYRWVQWLLPPQGGGGVLLHTVTPCRACTPAAHFATESWFTS